MSFLFWLPSFTFVTKSDGDWWFKWFPNICLLKLFSSFLISFKNSSRNFNEELLRLVFAFAVSVSASVSVAGAVAGFGAGWCVGVLSKNFIGNNLLWILSRFFYLALTLNNNPKLLKGAFFSNVFLPLSKSFNSLAKVLWLLWAFSTDKYPLHIRLKETIGNEYLPKL